MPTLFDVNTISLHVDGGGNCIALDLNTGNPTMMAIPFGGGNYVLVDIMAPNVLTLGAGDFWGGNYSLGAGPTPNAVLHNFGYNTTGPVWWGLGLDEIFPYGP